MTPHEHLLDATSLERIIPDELKAGEATGKQTLEIHVNRYRFASSHLVAGRVLDMACGVGYGTSLLSENQLVTHALGVDLSSDAVTYARERYASDRVTFLCADANCFSSDRRFENIVSLETIEHMDDADTFFSHLLLLLEDGGRLVISAPVTPTVDADPFHRSNFSRAQLLRLGRQHNLKYVGEMTQFQRFNPVTIALRKEVRAQGLRRNLVSFYIRHPSHFFLRLGSIMRHGFVNKYLTVAWQKCPV